MMKKTRTNDTALLGRGPFQQPPILPTSRVVGRLLVQRPRRRQIRLLLQQRGLDLQLQGGVLQRPWNRVRPGDGNGAGSSGDRR